jgi:hypothetical protein
MQLTNDPIEVTNGLCGIKKITHMQELPEHELSDELKICEATTAPNRTKARRGSLRRR